MTGAPLSGLQHLAVSLRELDVKFCLVGGLAVSVRAEVRFTRDVDVCVGMPDDPSAEALIFKLQSLGYSVLATVEQQKHGRLATARLKGPTGTICDLLFASSGIEAEVAERATLVELVAGESLPVARVEELLALKVLSSVPARPLDGADIQQLLLFNPDADLDVVRANLALIEARGYQRDQNLQTKLDGLIGALAPR